MGPLGQQSPLGLATSAAGILGAPMTGGASLALPVAANAFMGAKNNGFNGMINGAVNSAIPLSNMMFPNSVSNPYMPNLNNFTNSFMSGIIPQQMPFLG